MCKTVQFLFQNIKSIGFIIGIAFSALIFLYNLSKLPAEVHTRIGSVETRMAKTEARISSNENKISMIEVKLDTLLKQSSETCRDVKDIYHIIMRGK